MHEAGYEVSVGYRADSTSGIRRDAEHLYGRPWRWTRFDVSRDSPHWLGAAVRQKAAQLLVRGGVATRRLEAEAYCRGYGALSAWARGERADLYIGHTQPVLPVVASAAERTASRYAFDCEDLLSEEPADGLKADWRRQVILSHERNYLPRARYVSTTSIPMRDYLRTRHGLSCTHVWHNCFPLAYSAGVEAPRPVPPNKALRMAWLSATVGPNRGLEDAIAALRTLDGRFELHVYGNLQAHHQTWWRSIGGEGDDSIRVERHPLLAEPEMIPQLSRYDIGLALEPPDSLNKDLTSSNKLFLYLQAGLAVVASATAGQRSVLEGTPPLGLLYPSGNVAALGAALRSLADDEMRLTYRLRAWQAGRTRYNWDLQKEMFLEAVQGALAT